MSDACYYVYLHRRESDNKVFYVGKGKGYRCNSRSGRNSRWNKTVNKHGLIVELVYENLTEEDAFELEKDTILEMRYHFEETLCNLTDGGEGVSGYKWSDLSNHPSKKLIGKKQDPDAVERRASKIRGRKREKTVVKDIQQKIRKSKAGSIAFTQMVRYLKGLCQFQSVHLKRLNFPPEQFHREVDHSNKKPSASCIENSLKARKGNPAHNRDTSVYTFVSPVGEIFQLTRFDLSQKIGKDINNTMKHIGRMICGKRLSVFGWRLRKEENE